MPPERLALIRRIETLRNSSVICYLTSLRQNVPAKITQDHVRVMFDHLLRLPTRPVERLDIFLASNGGDSVVPWRLVALFREFAKTLAVLVPYRAYSAATLLTLGADEIVMHPFAELGPIDPKVSNEFNPREERTGRVVGINVEDVRAYIGFIKKTVGITHEDELVKTIEVLADKVHPLALGNVERFAAQSRMMAKKILRTHMNGREHEVNEIVENLASKLYFHGHPINRREAKHDLGLKVTLDAGPELESLLWDLYRSYEDEFENSVPFDPLLEVKALTAQAPKPLDPAARATAEVTLLLASIESASLSSRFISRRRLALEPSQGRERALADEVLEHRWYHSSA